MNFLKIGLSKPTSRLIHFLHIGKTAGTELKRISKESNRIQKEVEFRLHKHNIRLMDLPRESEYFFSIRHPFTRFVSGFESRRRKGSPRLQIEWSEDEKLAFSIFSDANELAESLFYPGTKGRMAQQALNAISHLSMRQTAWFSRVGFFLQTHPPVLVVRQEQFDRDVDLLFRKLGLSRPPLSSDPILSHIGAGTTADLSESARANLAIWYADDLALVDMLNSWIQAEHEIYRPGEDH